MAYGLGAGMIKDPKPKNRFLYLIRSNSYFLSEF